MWGFDDEECVLLLEATVEIPSLRAVLARAVPRPDLAEDLCLVAATPAELDEMYSLVEELIDGNPSEWDREVLEGLLASLCSSIDGF